MACDLAADKHVMPCDLAADKHATPRDLADDKRATPCNLADDKRATPRDLAADKRATPRDLAADKHAVPCDLANEKRALRTALRQAEACLPDAYITQASKAICAQLIALPAYERAQTIFCFVGVHHEPQTRAFLSHALKSGKRVCVPLCIRLGEMEAREIRDLGELQASRHGLLEPPASAPRVDERDIDLAIIPCLSCTINGDRLGKGGGFYDRFLADYQGESVLLCLHRMLSKQIPMEPHDRPVRPVLTDNGLYTEG